MTDDRQQARVRAVARALGEIDGNFDDGDCLELYKVTAYQIVAAYDALRAFDEDEAAPGTGDKEGR